MPEIVYITTDLVLIAVVIAQQVQINRLRRLYNLIIARLQDIHQALQDDK